MAPLSQSPSRAEWCLPPRNVYVEVLTPGTSERDGFWSLDFYRANEVKMRSPEWILAQQDWCLYKRRSEERHTQVQTTRGPRDKGPSASRGERPRRTQPCRLLDLGLLVSRAERKESVVVEAPAWGPSLQPELPTPATAARTDCRRPHDG